MAHPGYIEYRSRIKEGERRKEDRQTKRKQERGGVRKGEAIIYTLSLSRTPALTFPTSVFIREVGTASVYASFPNSSLMAV